jgi:hypothetical protein
MNFAIRKALFAVTVFTVAGIAGWFLLVTDTMESLPLGIFYALLVVNAYPSIKLFATIVPQDNGQHALADIILLVSYLFVASSLGQPLQFALCGIVLFLIAAGKYALMLHEIPHPELLQRKLRIDLLGAGLCAIALATMLLGHVFEGSWIMATIFALANIDILFLRPLYRL